MVTEVKPITYALQFRGHATSLGANLVRLELTAEGVVARKP
jgi:hypothetical protein